MRWIFYSLIILNLAYLGWHLTGAVVAPPGDRERAQVQPGGDLELLAERMGDEAVPDSTPEVASRPGLCPMVGAWQSREQAEQALGELARSYDAQLRTLRVERDALDWVFVPPAQSREEAMRTLRELQSRGVDSFIVDEGDDANAISLGFFSSSDSARGLKVKMENEGYPVEVRRTSREVTEYWLRLAPDSITDDGEALRAFLAAHPDRELEHARCDDGRPAS